MTYKELDAVLDTNLFVSVCKRRDDSLLLDINNDKFDEILQNSEVDMIQVDDDSITIILK